MKKKSLVGICFLLLVACDVTREENVLENKRFSSLDETAQAIKELWESRGGVVFHEDLPEDVLQKYLLSFDYEELKAEFDRLDSLAKLPPRILTKEEIDSMLISWGEMDENGNLINLSEEPLDSAVPWK